MLALLGAHHIVHVSRIRVKNFKNLKSYLNYISEHKFNKMPDFNSIYEFYGVPQKRKHRFPKHVICRKDLEKKFSTQSSV